MASFANKVRGNADLKAAAGGLGMKPGQVKTRSDMKRIRQEAKSRAEAASSAGASQQNSSAPAGGGASSYAPTTVGGNYVSSGINTITDLLGKYPGNETLAGLGVGTIFDIGRTQANTGLGIAYNDAFLGSLGNYQSGQENLRTANASKLMAQEGAITRDLTDLVTGRSLEGTKYTADRGLEGAKYGFDSQERQIGLTGAEERKNMTQKGIEERKMRADARGAIRSQGARFYG